MTSVLGRRSWLLAGLVCAGLGASVAVAVQSGASAGGLSARAAAPSPAAPGLPKPAAARPAVLATNAHCGQVLIASLTLNGDLFCTTGPALTIGKNSVVLNLGGHRVDGSGTVPYGVQIMANSATVTNGAITNFASYGVLIYNPVAAATSNTVSAIHAVNNFIGIYDLGTASKITNCIAARGTHGIVSGGTGGAYSGDHELNNTGDGLRISGSKAVATSNVANGNASFGIYDLGSGNTLTKNTANFNGGDGINAATDLTVVDGAGNLAKGNDYTSGPSQQCSGVVCT